MQRDPLSRRALLRIGGLGVVGLAGCVFEDGDRTGQRTTERTATRTPTDEPTTRTPTRSTTTEPTERTTERTTEETTAEEETTDEQPSEGPPDLCTANPRITGSDPLLVERNSRELRKCAGRPLDSFENLDPWADISGSIATDSGSFVGTQSMRMETTGDPYLSARRQFPEGIDLSDRDLSLAVDLETPENEQLEIRLFAPDVENSVSCKRKFNAAGWYRLDFGPTEIRGSPDLTDVRELQIRLRSASSPLKMSVDSLRTTERAERGAVLLTFDDNDRTQYETAFPITEEFGFPGTVGVITDSVGKDRKIPLEGMHEMGRAGWEMVSHPQESESVPEMSSRERRREIRESKRWLVDNGFERGAQHLIWPYNHYDADSLEVASRYHHLGFAYGACPVGRQVTGPLSIGRVHGDEVEQSKRMIDLAAAYGDLVVLMYHTIGSDDDRIGESEFRDVMAHIDRADVDVITPTDLWESLST